MQQTKQDNQLDQRSIDRYDVRLAIFYGQEEQRLMTDYSVNLSSGGVFIETSNVLPKDESLYVEFMLPNNDYVISCKSRVAWTNRPDEIKSRQLPSGMGLQFIDLPLEHVRTIRNFLTEVNMVPVW